MSEAGQNSTGKPGSDIEQLLVNIQNLDAESKKDFVARSMKQVLQDPELLAQAVNSIENVEAKKAAATSAVESAQDGGKKEVATAAVKAAHDPTTQEEILAELQSTLVELPKMIGQMIAWCLVIIAVVGVLILFMSVQGELGAASLLVTISIAVVSTLAGYCLGAASLVTEKLKKRPDLKGLVGKGINSRE